MRRRKLVPGPYSCFSKEEPVFRDFFQRDGIAGSAVSSFRGVAPRFGECAIGSQELAADLAVRAAGHASPNRGLQSPRSSALLDSSWKLAEGGESTASESARQLLKYLKDCVLCCSKQCLFVIRQTASGKSSVRAGHDQMRPLARSFDERNRDRAAGSGLRPVV